MNPRRGFTLLEVTLVLAVMVILAAIAYPSIEAMYGDLRVSAAADQIRARWAEARAKAIEEGRSYRFSVQADGLYRIAPDDGEYWSGGGGAPLNDSDLQPLVVEESLPDGIKFSNESASADSDGGPWTTLLKFHADGTASEDKTITLQVEGYRPVQLRVRALTGAVSSEILPMGKTS